jgi:pimeloyl-ACP methyl ester carboxylesterase
VPTFTSFDGVTLAYHDDGEGAPVVLLHGFAADTNLNYVRSGVFDLLLDEGYRVIALDSRGHGLSEKPHDPAAYGDDAMRRDVQALLDELGIERCVIVGYSMGAAVTLRVAMTDPRPVAVALLGAGENMADKQGGTVRRTSMAEAFRADDVEVLPARVRAFREMADAIRADRVALGALLDAPWPDTATGLDEVAVPVIVICGVDDDEVGSPDALASQLADAEVVLVPGDHFTANSKPELHEALIAFLGRVGS